MDWNPAEDWRLDHLVEVVHDLGAARARSQRLFGREPDWSTDQGGLRTLEWRTPSGALEILCPPGDVPPESRGLRSLVLQTPKLESARARLAAAGLEPTPIVASSARDTRTGCERAWRRFRCPDEHLGGLKLFVLEREAPVEAIAAPRLAAVEFQTGDPAGLMRLFGESLGIPKDPNGAHWLGAVRLGLGAVRLEVAQGAPGDPHRISGFRTVAGGGPYSTP